MLVCEISAGQDDRPKCFAAGQASISAVHMAGIISPERCKDSRLITFDTFLPATIPTRALESLKRSNVFYSISSLKRCV